MDCHSHLFDDDQPTAIPYGVYDLATNTGWVNVGSDHDTAEFATEAIRRWWHRRGRVDHPDADRLLISADAGGRGDLDRHRQPVQPQQPVHRTWLKDHPRIHHDFIPVGASWLNLQEGWWHIFRKRPSPAAHSPTPTTSHTPPHSRPANSTPARSHGSGVGPHRRPDDYGANMCTPFEESSTRTAFTVAMPDSLHALPRQVRSASAAREPQTRPVRICGTTHFRNRRAVAHHLGRHET